MKRIISFFTALSMTLMLFTGIPISVSAADSHQDHKLCINSVCGDTSVAAGNACAHGEETWTAWDSANSLPTETGYYYLTQNVKVKATGSSFSKTSETKINGDVVLCLNGKTVTNEATGNNKGDRIFIVPRDKTLTICDCTGNGKLTGAVGSISSNTRGAVEVSGTFNMYGGNISENSTDGVYVSYGEFNMYGGRISENDQCGVYGDGSSSRPACFTMYGGEITANKSTGVNMYQYAKLEMNGGSVTNHTVKTNGVGVIVGTSVEFVMNGGEISGNVNEDSYTGAGVNVWGTFTMNGGAIRNNIIGSSGGGVNISNGGTFNFNDGEITGNKSTGNGWGGGINVDGILNMTGGKISGNQASYGGGVYISSVGSYTHTANISGGRIVGNSVVDRASGQTARGGGILSQGGTLNLDGAVEVSGNTYNGEPNDLFVWYEKCLVNIGENFDIEGSHIGVLHGEAATCLDFKYVTAAQDRDVSKAFFADTDKYILEWDSRKKQIKFYAAHTPGEIKPNPYVDTQHIKECTVCKTYLLSEDHEFTSEETKSATCTETGENTLTCSVCGYSKTEEISAKGHTEVEIPAIAATCTTSGKTAGTKCSVCGTITQAQTSTAMLGHSLGDWKTTKAATCTATGTKERACTRTGCTYKETDTIAKIAHTAVTDPAVQANCTETGKTAGSHCSVCNTVLTAQTTVAALGHDFGDWTVDTPANCTTAGTESRSCQRAGCAETETRAIPAKGHSYVDGICSVCGTIDDNHTHRGGTATCTEQAVCDICGEPYGGLLEHTPAEIPAVEPTCTNTGLTAGEKCSVCNTVLTAQTTVAALGHDFGDWTVDTPANCTTAGTESRSCQRAGCAETETRTIPAKGHSYVDGICSVCGTIDDNHTHRGGTATCTEQAVCDICGEPYGSTAAHTPEEIPAIAATCTETGKTAGTKCSVCNTVLTAQTNVTALGHDLGAWTVDTPATCTTAGTEKRSCQRAGCAETETREIPAKGHSYVDGICSVCGTIDDNHTHRGGTATCTEQAICEICNQPYGSTSAHTPEEIPAIAPTCTETGLTAGTKCSVCNTVLTAQTTVTALGHNLGAWTVDTPATCTTAGSEKRFCQRAGCTETETRAIPAKGHNYVDGICSVCGAIDIDHEHRGGTATCASQAYCEICGKPYGELLEHTPAEIPAVEPTCTNTGLTAGVKCSVCNAVILQQDVISMIEHISGGWIVEVPATTASEGVRVKKCTVCGTELEREAIEKLPGINTGDVAEDVQDTAGTNAGLVQDNTLIENTLTPEDKADIENGSSFKISLEVTDIRDSVSSADVAAASSSLKSGEKIGIYVDLSLFKIKDNTERTPIYNTSGQIGITLTIPESIYASDRTYSIIRVHNGAAKNLGGTYDKTSRELTFYTDKFSTYVIAYTASNGGTDRPAVPDKPSTPSVPTYPTTPVKPVTPTVTETTSKNEDEVISDEPYVEDVSSAAGIYENGEADSNVHYVLILIFAAAAGIAVIAARKRLCKKM